MVGEASGHGRGALAPAFSFVLQPEGTDRPAEVVGVECQVGHGLVDLVVLAEAVGLPRLPGVAAPVGGVLTLQEGCVHLDARLRGGQGGLQGLGRAEDLASLDPDHASALAVLVHHRIGHGPGQATLGHDPGAARAAMLGLGHRLAEDLADRRLVGRVGVAGDQGRRVDGHAGGHLLDDGAGVLLGPGARDHGQDQPMLGVECDVIPVVAAVVVGRVVGVEVGLLLGDVGPLLIELDLAGRGGKRPRARRGRPRRAGRRASPGG